MRTIKLIILGFIIGLFFGYAWHFFAVKDKLEVYRNYEQVLRQKNAEITNFKFRSELCCGYILHNAKKRRSYE